MTESCTVGHQAVSAVDRDSHLLWQHPRGGQMKKLNIVEDIHKVRGARLFPCGQFVCNGLEVVRLWGDRRGGRVWASGKLLMQPEGDVSHCKPLSIQTGIIRSTIWFNHSHYCDIWHWVWNKGFRSRCVSYHTMSQWALTYFLSQAVSTEGALCLHQTPLLWDTATLSPFLTSISHFVINYWSLEPSKKRATYPENKLNLSCLLIENTLYR